MAAPAKVCAEVAELADALHSGCSARQGVEVRVLSSAPGSRLPRFFFALRQTEFEKSAAGWLAITAAASDFLGSTDQFNTVKNGWRYPG